jgi:hypothetical protein
VPPAAAGHGGNDSLIPVPDYVYYQDQAEEIDKLTARIARAAGRAEGPRLLRRREGKNNLNNLLNSEQHPDPGPGLGG